MTEVGDCYTCCAGRSRCANPAEWLIYRQQLVCFLVLFVVFTSGITHSVRGGGGPTVGGGAVK